MTATLAKIIAKERPFGHKAWIHVEKRPLQGRVKRLIKINWASPGDEAPRGLELPQRLKPASFVPSRGPEGPLFHGIVLGART